MPKCKHNDIFALQHVMMVPIKRLQPSCDAATGKEACKVVNNALLCHYRVFIKHHRSLLIV